MSTSPTTEDTTLPMAVPTMTATARASALVLRRKPKNSLMMALLLLGGLLGEPALEQAQCLCEHAAGDPIE